MESRFEPIAPTIKTISYERDFLNSLKFVLDHECLKYKNGTFKNDCYTNDPADPGGETKFGISKRAYPSLDIKNLGLVHAILIYYKDYWKPIAESLPFPLNFVAFDSAVQHGRSKARVFLKDSKKDWKKMLELRRIYYLKLNNPRFINGWLARLNDLSKEIDILLEAYSAEEIK